MQERLAQETREWRGIGHTGKLGKIHHCQRLPVPYLNPCTRLRDYACTPLCLQYGNTPYVLYLKKPSSRGNEFSRSFATGQIELAIPLSSEVHLSLIQSDGKSPLAVLVRVVSNAFTTHEDFFSARLPIHSAFKGDIHVPRVFGLLHMLYACHVSTYTNYLASSSLFNAFHSRTLYPI